MPDDENSTGHLMNTANLTADECVLIIATRGTFDVNEIGMRHVGPARIIGEMLRQMHEGGRVRTGSTMGDMIDLLATMRAHKALELPLDDDLIAKIIFVLGWAEGRRIELSAQLDKAERQTAISSVRTTAAAAALVAYEHTKELPSLIAGLRMAFHEIATGPATDEDEEHEPNAA